MVGIFILRANFGIGLRFGNGNQKFKQGMRIGLQDCFEKVMDFDKVMDFYIRMWDLGL